MMATTFVRDHWKYDVFVSFRGEDIRKSFMDHLFKDFKQKGIHAFRDDDELPRGEDISPQLYKAIEESRFLVVIFSKNYASSSWCLKELVKIMECKQLRKCEYHVRITFYDVKPTVVRNQTESFAIAFTKHEITNIMEVDGWKEALVMAANFSGWDLQDMANGYESKFIDIISKEILENLCVGPLHVGENLVGLDARVSDMNLLRFLGSTKVHMIGISGVGGIGKTTLAKAIYNLMYIHFEECIFLDDVGGSTKRHGLTHVIMKLVNDIMKMTDVKISNSSQGIMLMKKWMPSRRILLVLDDVDHHDQLEALAGSCDWFSPGSLIIFTGKDKQLLANKAEEILEMKFLHYTESLELFCLYAFHRKHPTKDFKELVKQVLQYVQGHPLALKVLGCFLYGKPMSEWKSELDGLQVHPNEEIQRVLRLSFDGLNLEQKKVFLDIACLFIGVNKDFVGRILDSCNYFADTNIRVLVDKSLVTISSNGLLKMHELIQRMAREIVCEESPNMPGNRSRLWISSEVYEVLNGNKATEAIEALNLLLEESSQKVHIDCKAFERMKKLRILQICDRELRESSKPFKLKLWNESKVNYTGRLKFLSNNLRLLYWHGCPFKFFPTDFYPENIVAIDLSYSHIKSLWATPKCFNRLKVMTLNHCRDLASVPDFTKIKNLEELNLEGCVSLVNVHPSFGILKKLVVLNMKNCKRFRSFPCKVEWDSLEVMILSGCYKVGELPIFSCRIQSLKKFCVDKTGITELPSFVFSQRNLQVLKIGQREKFHSRQWTSISHPSSLQSKMQHFQRVVIPSFAGLCFLQELDISNCNIFELPESIGGLSCLEYLCLYNNNFTTLPKFFSQLSHLRMLGVSGCKNLEVLPELPPSIVVLYACNCTSLQELQGRPNNIHTIYYFEGCPQLSRYLTIERKVSILQPRHLNSSVVSHGSNNQLYSFLRYLNIPSTVYDILTLQERMQGHRYVDIMYCGNNIPEWFTNQSMGNNVGINLPPNWCYNKFRGYGACFVFTSKKPWLLAPKCYVKNFDGDSLVYSDFLIPYIDHFTKLHELDITWIRFSTKTFGWSEAKNSVMFSFIEGYGGEVKECGVRLICDEDIEEETYLSITKYLPVPTEDGCDIELSLNYNGMRLHL